MPSHLELIQEKLDTLTLMVENQNKKIKHLESIQIQNETILEVVSDLSSYANSQRKRQQDIDELKNDLVPKTISKRLQSINLRSIKTANKPGILTRIITTNSHNKNH